jgi:hypothetical protein
MSSVKLFPEGLKIAGGSFPAEQPNHGLRMEGHS